MSELRAAAEKIFSEVKKNWPDFDEQKYESVIKSAESQNLSPDEFSYYLFLMLSGYFPSQGMDMKYGLLQKVFFLK